MFKNYFKIALRLLSKQKIYAFINVFGLAVGIACCILIYLFIRDEWSYDRFQEKADDLYRVYITEDLPQRDPFSYSVSPAQLAGALEQSFPEVEKAVRIDLQTDVIRVGDKTFTERTHLADPDFFEVFTFPLLEGKQESVLESMNDVVLTRRMAEKLFGRQDVLQQHLSIKLGDEFYDFIVSGIAADPPPNSSIQFDILISLDNVKKYVSEQTLSQWFDVFLETYVLLAPDHKASEFESKLAAVVKQHYPERSADMVTLHLQPITDIHLNPDVPAGFEPVSDPKYSFIMAAIALLVLIIACINFTTLAIGRSSHRSREVGVRKVLGANKSQLLKQFWGEAFLMSFLALLVAFLLIELFLPFFNDLSGKQLATTFDFVSIFTAFVLTLLVGLFAGGYPAFALTATVPITTIRGKKQAGQPRLFGRSLIVLQFTLSIFLVISTLVMADQLHFLRNKNLGFDKEQVVVIRNNAPGLQSRTVVQRLRQTLANRPEIIRVAGASADFATQWTQMGFRDDAGDFKQFYQITVDYDYLPTMRIQLLEGRNFSRDFATDSSEAVIVNQALAEYFDWDSALGKSLPGPGFPPHHVIGVVQDFNYDALKNDIGPLVMVLNPSTLMGGINDLSTTLSPQTLNYIHIRIAPDNMLGTIELLRHTWKQTAGAQPFLFSFLDQDLEKRYRQEERWGKIVAYASVFAITIACLGLFGLATLAVSKRTKEIGVRKVLGASVPNIFVMLSNDFGKLVLLANLIAWPAAYLLMRRWLQDFAYRTAIGIDNFILAAIVAALFALLAVSYQSIKAARSNPVESLRYE